MSKNFDARNILKKEIHSEEVSMYAHPREIWYIKLWLNIGFEEDGKELQKWYIRPVLILSKVGNMYTVLPMTTKGKISRYYYRIQSIDFWKTSDVIISQIRSVDSKRFVEKMGMISKDEFFEIQKKVQELHFPNFLVRPE